MSTLQLGRMDAPGVVVDIMLLGREHRKRPAEQQRREAPVDSFRDGKYLLPIALHIDHGPAALGGFSQALIEFADV